MMETNLSAPQAMKERPVGDEGDTPMSPEEVLLEFDSPDRGPKGGDLTVPPGRAYRESAFNSTQLPNGGRVLHSTEKNWVNTAVPGVKDEQPWHRLAAVAMLAGQTDAQIAKAADCTAQYLGVLRAQRWFKELLATLAEDQRLGLVGLINAQAASAWNRITEIAEGAENERVALAANMYIVDQAHGKPIQKVVGIHATTQFASPQDEMAALQKELAELRRSVTVPCATGAAEDEPQASSV